jgi:large subunit ribosomal protein L13
MSTAVATKLMGKDKPQYTPHLDLGDYVIVINADKVKLTGNKEQDKMYYNHSGFPGGMRKRNAATMREKYPEEMVKRAI